MEKATVADVPDEPSQPPVLTAPALAQTTKEQIITPFDVSGGVDEHGKAVGIDYDKLIVQFGTKRIDKELLDRFEKVTGKRPHRLMRRGKVFSHRDLTAILDTYEKGTPFFIYTGRGPSSTSMHVGHSIPFEFTKYLQDVFDVPLVIMMTDDEKFFHSAKLKQEECYQFARDNVTDVIAIGFDPAKTFIFIDSQFMDSGHGAAFMYNVRSLAKRTTISQIKGTFGFGDSNNIAEFHFPAIQSASSFATSFPFIFGADKKKAAKIPCLIPCGVDQDPYFRQCRDHATKIGLQKPALIHSGFMPSLKGKETKMSASEPDSGIWLSDTPKQIQKKIGNSFSGGQETLEQHRELGGRADVDIPFQYLTFFLEDDDELEQIRVTYEKGEMLTGEIKKRCTQELQAYVAAFQERRKKVDDSVRDLFLKPRALQFKGSPFSDIQAAKEKEIAELEKRIAELKAS